MLKFELRPLMGSGASASAAGRKHTENFLESVANTFQVGDRVRREGEGRLIFLGLNLCAELLPGADDGEALFIQKFLDSQHSFNILAPVHSLPGPALGGLQLREFGFPEAKNVGRKTA